MLMFNNRHNHGRGWAEQSVSIIIRPELSKLPKSWFSLFRKKHIADYKFVHGRNGVSIFNDGIDKPTVGNVKIFDELENLDTEYPFFISYNSIIAYDLDNPGSTSWEMHHINLRITMVKSDAILSLLSMSSLAEFKIDVD